MQQRLVQVRQLCATDNAFAAVAAGGGVAARWDELGAAGAARLGGGMGVGVGAVVVVVIGVAVVVRSCSGSSSILLAMVLTIDASLFCCPVRLFLAGVRLDVPDHTSVLGGFTWSERSLRRCHVMHSDILVKGFIYETSSPLKSSVLDMPFTTSPDKFT